MSRDISLIHREMELFILMMISFFLYSVRKESYNFFKKKGMFLYTFMFHNFHILSLSSYPYYVFLASFGLTSSFVFWFKYGFFYFFIFCLLSIIFIGYSWGYDIFMEGLSGYHNFFVMDGFKFGMLLFIFSELMFFVSIFWTFFDSALVPLHTMGEQWVPFGLYFFKPYYLAHMNTQLLLSSSFTVTWVHHNLLSGNNINNGMFMTLFLAILFLMVQFFEYNEAKFSISDGVFGSIFYFSTGFHGIHVLCGTLMLMMGFWRLNNNHFSSTHNVGLEFSILYWHFVDVVWLFLYMFVYWWSF